MNFYFYAPKEDQNHDLIGKNHIQKWLRNFNNFTSKANFQGISIIAGIAPGLDYNFNYGIINEDFNILKIKSKQLLNNGANYIALMFDDIPNNFKNIYSSNLIEGKSHAKLSMH